MLANLPCEAYNTRQDLELSSHAVYLQVTPALIASHLSTRQLPQALQVGRAVVLHLWPS